MHQTTHCDQSNLIQSVIPSVSNTETSKKIINFEDGSLEPHWRKKTVFLCVLVKVQNTRNKPHAWQSGTDSPLIEMAPIQCNVFTEQSSRDSAFPSLGGSTSLPHSNAWKGKQQDNSKMSRCSCTWLNQNRTFSFGREAPKGETVLLRKPWLLVAL